MNSLPTETNSCNIDEGIFQLLTQNPNEWMSAINLYNQYTKEHYVNKKEFIINCELLTTRFKNIRKCHKNNICYLNFGTDNSLITKEVYDEEIHDDYKDDELFRSLDKCDVIEYMVKNSHCCENLSLTDFFDDIDTVLHILFRKGRIDLINTLISCYSVDFDIKNKNNEDLLDVLDYSNKDAQKLVKLVFEYRFSKLNKKYNDQLDSIKHHNTLVLETNRKLIDENKLLKKRTAALNLYKGMAYISLIVLAIKLFFY